MPGRRAIVTGASKGSGARSRPFSGRGAMPSRSSRARRICSTGSPRSCRGGAMPLRRSRSRRICATSATRRGSSRRQPPPWRSRSSRQLRRGDEAGRLLRAVARGFSRRLRLEIPRRRRDDPRRLPRLRESGTGHVVNIIGAAARTPVGGFRHRRRGEQRARELHQGHGRPRATEKVRARASASSTSTRRTG